jgi:predicted dehydrogenase
MVNPGMVKIGLIGVGYLGKIHLGLLMAMKDVEFVGFFDTNEENSTQLHQQYSFPIITKAEDLMDQCDALVVASPTSTHFDYAKKCIQAGKHVFVEKPVTSHLQEAAALLPVLHEHQVKLQVGMVERFNPAFLAVSPYIKNVEKIFCNRLAPFTYRGADVSVVFDVMIHDLDVVLSMANSEVKNIRAFGQKIISETYDIATATVEFESGLIANFTASRQAERKYRLMEIIEPDHIYRVDFLHKTSIQFSMADAKKISLEEAYIHHSAAAMKQYDLPVTETNAIGEELKSFVDSIINNKKVVVSLDDGIRAMQLAKDIEDQMNHQS